MFSMKRNICLSVLILAVVALMAFQVYAARDVILYTLDGSPVEAETDRIEQDDKYSESLEAGIALFPTATIVAPATRLYNCHSYAWYSNYSNYWINNPMPFILDDHTVSVTNVQFGDRIVYYDSYGLPAHSGFVVMTSPIVIESKWGQGPLVNHFYEDVPPEYLNNGVLDVAFYRYPDDHSFVFDSPDEFYHEAYCTVCGLDTVIAHQFNESGVCVDCGYVFHLRRCD